MRGEYNDGSNRLTHQGTSKIGSMVHCVTSKFKATHFTLPSMCSPLLSMENGLAKIMFLMIHFLSKKVMWWNNGKFVGKVEFGFKGFLLMREVLFLK